MSLPVRFGGGEKVAGAVTAAVGVPLILALKAAAGSAVAGVIAVATAPAVLATAATLVVGGIAYTVIKSSTDDD